MDNLVWDGIPDIRTLDQTIRKHAHPLNLIVCLPDNQIPDFQTAQDASDSECRLKHRLDQATQCLQFDSINLIEHILPDVRFWLVPPSRTRRLHEHFHHISWQTEAIPQTESKSDKPWFALPQTSERKKPEHVLVIGAGIAGASTAHALASHGISVTVLEARKAAQAASGNRQGLLYAKISPHDTGQTELLLAGYGYTKRLLGHILPDSDTWGGNGIIHLNYSRTEQQRNHELGLQKHHNHLYRSITSAEAEKIAGIPLNTPYAEPLCGLYWQHGVWLNPPAFVRTLLSHPLIELYENTTLTGISHDGEKWIASTPNGTFTATHIIYCTGAHSPCLPETNLAALPLRQIRGQPASHRPPRFPNNCVAPFQAKATSARRGTDCTATARVLFPTAAIPDGTKPKKPQTAKHWHTLTPPLPNHCLPPTQTPKNTKGTPPYAATAPTTSPSSAHSATLPPCGRLTPNLHWTKTTASTPHAHICPMPTPIPPTAHAGLPPPPSAPPPLPPKS